MREIEIVFISVSIAAQRSWADFAAETGVPEAILRHLNPDITQFLTGMPVQIPTVNVTTETRVEWAIEHGQVKAYDTTPEPGVITPMPDPELARAVPSSYMLPTEEDLLRWMWTYEFDEVSSEAFEIGRARELFEQFIATAVAEKASWVRQGWTSGSWQFFDQGSDSDQHIADLLAFNLYDARGINDYLASLSLDDLLTLYNQLPSAARTELTPFEEATYNEFADYYLSLYTSYQHETADGVLQESAAPEADLAFRQFYETYFAGIDPADTAAIRQRMIDLTVGYFNSGALLKSALGLEWNATGEPLLEAVTQAFDALGPDATLGDYMALINEWATAQGEESLSIPEVAQYYEALALDDLRHLAYDPSEIDDEARLSELEDAVLALPRALFGVDIGFVQDAFLKYVNDLKRLREVRLRLRAQLEPIELNLTGQEASPLLSWVDELLLSVLFDFFDVIFSIRDLLQGNWLGLLGLLPLIPSAIAHLGEAARYAVNLTEETLESIGLLGRRAQDVVPKAPTAGYKLLSDWFDELHPQPTRTWAEYQVLTDELGVNDFIDPTHQYTFVNGPWAGQTIAFGSMNSAQYLYAMREGNFGMRLRDDPYGRRGLVPLEWPAIFDPDTDSFVAAWPGETTWKSFMDSDVGQLHRNAGMGFMTAIDLLRERGIPVPSRSRFLHIHFFDDFLSFEDFASAQKAFRSNIGADVLDAALRNGGIHRIEFVGERQITMPEATVRRIHNALDDAFLRASRSTYGFSPSLMREILNSTDLRWLKDFITYTYLD